MTWRALSIPCPCAKRKTVCFTPKQWERRRAHPLPPPGCQAGRVPAVGSLSRGGRFRTFAKKNNDTSISQFHILVCSSHNLNQAQHTQHNATKHNQPKQSAAIRSYYSYYAKTSTSSVLSATIQRCAFPSAAVLIRRRRRLSPQHPAVDDVVSTSTLCGG